jgi:hypothetical protein
MGGSEDMPSIAEAVMPRKKSEHGLKLAAVKVDRDIVTKAKLIAADKGEPLAGYLSGILRGTVEKDWAKVVRKAGTEEGGEK